MVDLSSYEEQCWPFIFWMTKWVICCDDSTYFLKAPLSIAIDWTLGLFHINQSFSLSSFWLPCIFNSSSSNFLLLLPYRSNLCCHFWMFLFQLMVFITHVYRLINLYMWGLFISVPLNHQQYLTIPTYIFGVLHKIYV